MNHISVRMFVVKTIAKNTSILVLLTTVHNILTRVKVYTKEPNMEP